MATSEILCEELLSIATDGIAEIEKNVPDNPVESFVLFTEMIRAYDSWAVSSEFMSWDKDCNKQYLDVMGLGWNLAANLFFKKMNATGFPIRESTDDIRKFATNILYRLGICRMIQRSVEMVKTGLLEVSKENTHFVFKKTLIMDHQFSDTLEFSELNELEEKIRKDGLGFMDGWNLVDVDSENIDEQMRQPGNFYGIPNREKSEFILDDIDALMEPLIFPWVSGHGTMMGYGGTEEIDFHFLALAKELVEYWREEAGFHPDVKLDGINGGELTLVVGILISFYLKHVSFARIASKKIPEINIPQSLPIWTPAAEMIEDIAFFLRLESGTVRKAFELLMFRAEDATFLKNHTSKFVPMLIDLGNGYVLRPVSSILHNPFFSIIALLEQRNPNIRHEISLPRERWIRTHLYAMFMGLRYQRVDGNVRLKEGSKVVTDIDAAIYDNLTGELALFQIKWQDFHFNDVKKLRSRASNLTKDLDEWAAKITQWLKIHPANELIKNLRLTEDTFISNLYLFGISRSKARMQGYGYSISSNNLAIANWPQFVRNRFEAGPTDRVFHTLFNNLKMQENEKVDPIPFPVTFNIGNYDIEFLDLYNGWESKKD